MRERRRAAAVLAAAASLLAVAVASAQLPPPEPQPETRPALARIVFSADGAIHTIAADGSDRRRVTTPGKETFDFHPGWSPDGATIAFTRLDMAGDEGQVLWLVNRDGSGLRKLLPDATPDAEAFGPSWSADGSQIAFVSLRFDEERRKLVNSLMAVRPDGSGARTIHRETVRDDEGYFAAPAWAPSGDRILFTRFELFSGRPDALHVVPAAGGDARRIVANGSSGAWAPGGDRIAYSSSGEIYVANADGSGRVRLTNSRANDEEPSWSGDGLRIAFESDRNSLQAESEDAPQELYSMRADGSCLTWLTNGTADSQTPDFERAAGLSSDPGACGAVPREPLVETGMPKELKRPFAAWWLGRIAPNGLLLTDVYSDPHILAFGYHDCGRFDPKECGEFVNVDNRDVCTARVLRRAGRPDTTLTLARGALLQETREELDDIGFSELFTHRTRIFLHTASGHPFPRALVDGLRRFPDEQANGGKLPSARLPVRLWRQLRTTKGVSRREVARRRAVARRLAQLGVKRRLGC